MHNEAQRILGGDLQLQVVPGNPPLPRLLAVSKQDYVFEGRFVEEAQTMMEASPDAQRNSWTEVQTLLRPSPNVDSPLYRMEKSSRSVRWGAPVGAPRRWDGIRFFP